MLAYASHRIIPLLTCTLKLLSLACLNIYIDFCLQICDYGMNDKLRKSDFKLGRIHGTMDPEKVDSEAQIQRNVYLNQSIRIKRSNNDTKNSLVRLFAYEMPLGHGRDECVDLVGYDAKHNLYLIELKKGSSTEDLTKVTNQISGYAKKVAEILKHIEDDFERTFFFRLKFGEIRRIILAPREFYEGKIFNDYSDSGIEYLYFRDKDITERNIGEPVSVHKYRNYQ